jgi:hypothetical protein
MPDEAAAGADTEPAELPVPVAIPPIEDVRDLDWSAIRATVSPSAIRSRIRATVEAFEALLDREEGPRLLFDRDRSYPRDQAIKVGQLDSSTPLWIIGDLHGDLLALEASLALIQKSSEAEAAAPPNIVLLGDLFDDEGFGLELLLRVFELILASPGRICVVVGNHDEALSFDGNRFATSVSPGDFADFLNLNLAHEWIERAGKLAVRFFEQAPHALFLPGRFAHRPCRISARRPPRAAGGERRLERSGLSLRLHLDQGASDRAQEDAEPVHPRQPVRTGGFRGLLRAQRPNGPSRHAHGPRSRPCRRSLRHLSRVQGYPVLTTVALSRRLPRESFGPHARVPTLARYLEGSLPTLHRLHIPEEVVNAIFPPAPAEREPAPEPAADGCGG